jgi:hypothetical protein
LIYMISLKTLKHCFCQIATRTWTRNARWLSWHMGHLAQKFSCILIAYLYQENFLYYDLITWTFTYKLHL